MVKLPDDPGHKCGEPARANSLRDLEDKAHLESLRDAPDWFTPETTPAFLQTDRYRK